MVVEPRRVQQYRNGRSFTRADKKVVSCQDNSLPERLYHLLMRWHDNERLSVAERPQLAKAIAEWRSSECPGNNPCYPHTCPYAEAPDWVTYRGYENIARLVRRLYDHALVGPIPAPGGIDALDAPRRPGSFSP